MNKKIWITGASSGIGEALAKEYSRQGAFVILSARREKELQRVQSELAHPDRSHILPMDITDLDTVDAKVKEVLDRCQHVDVLINNAGIDYKDWVRNTPLPIYRKVMDVNFFGNIAVTLKLLPHMEKRGSGQIVCISSVNGLLSDKCSSAYSAAKRALHGFYDSLRAECPPGLTVSIVAPGYVKTNITRNSLNGRGVAYGLSSKSNDQAMSPAVMARKVVKRLEKKSELVLVGGAPERFAVALHSWFPRLFYRVIRKVEPEYENNN